MAARRKAPEPEPEEDGADLVAFGTRIPTTLRDRIDEILFLRKRAKRRPHSIQGAVIEALEQWVEREREAQR